MWCISLRNCKQRVSQVHFTLVLYGCSVATCPMDICSNLHVRTHGKQIETQLHVQQKPWKLREYFFSLLLTAKFTLFYYASISNFFWIFLAQGENNFRIFENFIIVLFHFSFVFFTLTVYPLRSCRGRAVKTSDFHTGGPRSNPGPAVAPLGKALYPHCLVFRRRL